MENHIISRLQEKTTHQPTRGKPQHKQTKGNRYISKPIEHQYTGKLKDKQHVSKPKESHYRNRLQEKQHISIPKKTLPHKQT